MPSVPPPVPQRTSPSAPIPPLPAATVSTAVQTDPVQWIDKETVEKLIAEIGQTLLKTASTAMLFRWENG